MRRRFEAAAATCDQADVLDREVAERLRERLRLIRHSPSVILDVGSGAGLSTRGLREDYPGSRVIALDLAPAMLRRARGHGRWRRPVTVVCGDVAALPLATDSVDMVHSSLALQWCPDPDAVFMECRRVLKPGGLLMFATLGPDTLRELRESWARVDGHVHVHGFPDMHDIGDMLVHQRFADPVMDMERLNLTYDRLSVLLADLRAAGAANAHRDRSRGLTGRGRLLALEHAYEAFRGSDGRIPASWEIVYGHAWATGELEQTRDASGTVSVSFEAMRRKLRGAP